MTSVARRRGRVVEIVPDEAAADVPANDSGDAFASLDKSRDGEDGEAELDDRDAA